MRPARGFTIVQLGLALGILVAIIALGAMVNSWWESHNDAMKESGRQEVRDQVAQRDEKQRKAVEAERTKLAKEKEEKERKDALQIKEKEDEASKKLAQQRGEVARFVAAVNRGDLVWRKPGEAGGGAAIGPEAVLPEAAADAGACAGLIGGGTVPAQALPILRAWCGEAARADIVRQKLTLARSALAVCTGEADAAPSQ